MGSCNSCNETRKVHPTLRQNSYVNKSPESVIESASIEVPPSYRQPDSNRTAKSSRSHPYPNMQIMFTHATIPIHTEE
jgi:hypothetical protein